MFKKPYILCAAIHYTDGEYHVHQPKNIDAGYVICGRRHHNCLTSNAVITDEIYVNNWENKTIGKQGFLTSDDMFVSRKEAAKIAFESNQISEEVDSLISEDLY